MVYLSHEILRRELFPVHAQDIKRAVHFDVSAVHEALYLVPPTSVEQIAPCVAPVYPEMWFETTINGISTASESETRFITELTRGDPDRTDQAIAQAKFPVTTGNLVKIVYDERNADRTTRDEFYKKLKQRDLPNVDVDDVRWLLSFDLFGMSHASYDIFFIHHATMLVSDDGTPNIAFLGNIRDYFRGPNRDKTATSILLSTLHSMSLLHCKNIGTEDVHLSRQVRRQLERAMGDPVNIHKVLTVKPIGKSVSTSDIPVSKQSRLRYHIMRGHFKEYDENAPLFGKWTGRYWWSDTVRGKKSLGSVDKTYKLNPE